MRTVAVASVLIAVAAFAQNGGTIELTAGEQKVITVPAVQRIAIGDMGIADVKTLGNNQLLLIGTGAGKTTLLVWKQAGEKVSYLIKVKPAMRAKVPGRSDPVADKGTTEAAHPGVTVEDEQRAEGLALTALELKAGSSVKLSIDGVEKAAARDPKLVEASVQRPGSVTLNAKAPGDVTVELVVQGEPEKLLVKVLP